MQKNRKTFIAVIILLVLCAGAALVWYFNNPAADANSADKTISASIIHGDGSQKDFSIQTNEEFLRGALEQEKLIEGDEGEYGLYITAVDGEKADESNQQWWCVNNAEGEMLPTGVSDTAIQDGDIYEIVLETGW